VQLWNSFRFGLYKINERFVTHSDIDLGTSRSDFLVQMLSISGMYNIDEWLLVALPFDFKSNLTPDLSLICSHHLPGKKEDMLLYCDTEIPYRERPLCQSVRLSVKEMTGNFSLHHRDHTGSGAHPTSYPMGTKGSFSGDKAAGAWSWSLTSIYCWG
jgi:hypothetical protein